MLLDVSHAGLESLDVAVEELGLLLAELNAHGVDDGVLADDVGLLGDVGAEEDDVGSLEVADALGYLVAGDVDGVDVRAGGLDVDDGAVDQQQAAGLDAALELEQGGLVHRQDGVGNVDQRAGHGSVGDDDGAVGRAAAHLRAVAGQPGDVLAGLHAGLGKELAYEEHALSAKTCEYTLFLHILLGPLILVDTQRVVRDHVVFEPLDGLNRAHAPVGRAGGEDFDDVQAMAFHLVLERLLDGLLGLHDVRGGVQRDALGVVAVGDLAEHLANLDGSAAPLLAAAVGAGGGLQFPDIFKSRTAVLVRITFYSSGYPN